MKKLFKAVIYIGLFVNGIREILNFYDKNKRMYDWIVTHPSRMHEYIESIDNYDIWTLSKLLRKEVYGD